MPYIIYTVSRDKYYKFGDRIIIARKDANKQRIQWTYDLKIHTY